MCRVIEISNLSYEKTCMLHLKKNNAHIYVYSLPSYHLKSKPSKHAM